MEHRIHLRPWADLPPELLSIIASEYSVDAARHVSLRRVCRGWCASLTSHSYMSNLPAPQLPFLQQQPQTCPAASIGEIIPISVFNHFLDPHLVTNLPQLANEGNKTRICVGSSLSWLITLDSFSWITLLNPVTAQEIEVKPLSDMKEDLLQFRQDDHNQYRVKDGLMASHMSRIVHRVVLSSDPVVDKNFRLILFLEDLTNYCFTFSAKENCWFSHRHKRCTGAVDDVVCVNGNFVAFFPPRTLKVFEFRDGGTASIKNYMSPEPDRIVIYLVKSQKDLLLVYTKSTLPYGPTAGPFIQKLLLYKDFPSQPHKDIQPSDIDDNILFLSKGSSLAVSRQNFPWPTGNVYFCLREFEHGTNVLTPEHYARSVYHVAYENDKEVIQKVCNLRKVPFRDNLSLNSTKTFWVSPNIRRDRIGGRVEERLKDISEGSENDE